MCTHVTYVIICNSHMHIMLACMTLWSNYIQVQNLTEAEFQKNSSYNITTLPAIFTTVNGTNTSTIVFVVELLTGVNVTENTTLTPAVGDTSSGANYTVEQKISIIPSGKVFNLIV